MFRKDKTMLVLDIGSHATKIVEGLFNRKSGCLDVYFYGIYDELGVVQENGSIMNGDAFVKELKRVLKTYPVYSKDCVVCFSSVNPFIKEICLPIMDDKQIRYNLEIEIAEYLPMGMNEYIIDYKVMREILTDHARGYQIMVAALPRETVMAYLQLIREAGLRPKIVDVVHNARSKIFRFIKPKIESEPSCAVIDIGYKSTGISFFQNETPYSTKSVPWGMYHLSSDSGDVDPLDNYVSQISRMINYNQALGNDRIEKVYLSGGGSLKDGLMDQIRERLPQPVHSIMELSGSEKIGIQLQRSEDAAVIFNALGLLIREED